MVLVQRKKNGQKIANVEATEKEKHQTFMQKHIGPGFSWRNALILIVVLFTLSFANLTRPQRVLQIGMGGGATTNFLANMPVNLSIDTVEIDPVLYDVARRLFDLTENERVKVKIEDGAKFMERAVSEKIIYDSILLDATGSDEKYRYGPAPLFSRPKVIADLSKSISFSNLDSREHRVLQIGLGGGATTNFLATMPVELSIDVVELEPTVYDVAKKYFDLTENERVKVKIEDGVKFMERGVNENAQYDSILLDACTTDVKEAALCPAPVFRAPEVIENLSKLVGSTGVLSVNMFATRDREAQQEMIESQYQTFFLKCFSLRFNVEQKMLFCSNRKDFSWNGRKQRILGNLKDFDLRMRTNLHSAISTLNE
ncbi:hypothetical protein PRIPAC_73566 [Pristionchus pacificus]|uniref:Methyltransferase n=1 Tax=Pristionchus pacificus TaxID=54126 RepID=A0A2A6BG92_PRIPA|nr:hypothetical protein PRIPAC_73566 [Pristionchus pacificus]|eukprot:PDM64893.1 methyltransferase [Pristionchus pacificus]